MAENTISNEHLEMQDYDFRRAMRAKQAQDPQADKWVALDTKAQVLEREVSVDQREKSQRPGSVWQTELELTNARMDRDEFRQGNLRADFKGGPKKWDEQYMDLDNEVSNRQKAFGDALKNSSPEELAKLQSHIEQKREDLMKTIEQRQGIARLPSEGGQQAQDEQQNQRRAETNLDQEQDQVVQGSMEDRLANHRAEAQVQEAPAMELGSGQVEEAPAEKKDSTQVQEPVVQLATEQQGPEQDPYVVNTIPLSEGLATRRADAQEGQQAQEPGGVVGHRLRPNFSAYASTIEEENASKQLAEDQRTLWQELKRAPTDEEVRKFESDRADAQNQVAEQQTAATPQLSNAPSQQGQAEDIHAQVVQAPGSMAERLAARRQAGQQEEVQQGSGQEGTPQKVQQVEQAQEAQSEPRKADGAEQEQGASSVAERQAKKSEQQVEQSEAKAEQTPSKTNTRDWGDEDGMGI